MRKHQRRRPLTLSLRALSELVQEMMVQRAHHSGIQGRTIGPFVPVPQVFQITAGVGAEGVAQIPLCALRRVSVSSPSKSFWEQMAVVLLKYYYRITTSHYYIALLQ